jgi:hypothetical protein
MPISKNNPSTFSSLPVPMESGSAFKNIKDCEQIVDLTALSSLRSVGGGNLTPLPQNHATSAFCSLAGFRLSCFLYLGSN